LSPLLAKKWGVIKKFLARSARKIVPPFSKPCHRPWSALMGLVTFTLKLVCQSHQKWRTFLPNLGTYARPLGSPIISLFTRRTDRQTDKINAYCPFSPSLRAGHNKKLSCHNAERPRDVLSLKVIQTYIVE